MRYTSFGLFAVLTWVSLPASAGIIDFEGTPYTNGYDLIANSPGLPITGSAITYSVSGTSLGPDTGMVYDTHNAMNFDRDQDAPFTDVDTGATIDPGNIAVIGRLRTNGGVLVVDDTNNQGTLTFTLSEVVNFVSFRVFDVGDNAGNLTVSYFNKNGNNLGSMNVGAGVGDNETKLISFAAYNAKIAGFTFGGSGGIDDIAFTDVPEPVALGLLGALLFAGGIWARRGRRLAS